MTQVGRQDGLLHPTTVREVRALADRAHQEDGVAPLGEQTLLNLADPAAPVVHLLAGTGEVLEGYGQVEAGATMTAELVVTPRARNKGLGRALVAEVLAVAAENDAVPAVWAHGDLPAARAVASGSGLAVVRELWQMGADLPLEQEPAAVPDGVRLRPFVVGQDEHAWLAVNARAFAAHPEQGRMTLADLEAREREPWFDAAGPVDEAPFTLLGASTPYNERSLRVHLQTLDKRRDEPISITSTLTGRNTSYGYDSGECLPVPPA